MEGWVGGEGGEDGGRWEMGKWDKRGGGRGEKGGRRGREMGKWEGGREGRERREGGEGGRLGSGREGRKEDNGSKKGEEKQKGRTTQAVNKTFSMPASRADRTTAGTITKYVHILHSN